MSTDEKQAIIEELKDWAIATGRPLPYPAETIANYEAEGTVVDLTTGFLSPAVMDEPVALSAKGLAMYHQLRGGFIYGEGGDLDDCDNEHQRLGWLTALQADADATTAYWLAAHRQAVAA